MAGSADYYADGQWNFYCDLCGRKEKSGKAMKTWDGFQVCALHKEKRNPQDFVRGVKDNQTVPWSRPRPPYEFVNTYPYAVQNLTATATGGDFNITLTWDLLLNCTYDVYWSTVAGPGFQLGPGLGGTKICNVAMPFVFSGLRPTTPYYFVIVAVNGSTGQGPVSEEVTAVPYGVVQWQNDLGQDVQWQNSSFQNVAWVEPSEVIQWQNSAAQSINFMNNGAEWVSWINRDGAALLNSQ